MKISEILTESTEYYTDSKSWIAAVKEHGYEIHSYDNGAYVALDEIGREVGYFINKVNTWNNQEYGLLKIGLDLYSLHSDPDKLTKTKRSPKNESYSSDADEDKRYLSRKKYPDTRNGVIAMLQDNISKSYQLELDLPNCVFHADPSVEGVWAVDNRHNGMRVIVYLAGYKNPMGRRREKNDMEEGEIPGWQPEGLDLYSLTDKPESLKGYSDRNNIVRKAKDDRGLGEAKHFTKGQQAALSNFDQYPGMSSNDYYTQYRFGIAMAREPNPIYDMSKEGPIGDNFVTIAYSDADKKIIDAAKKTLGQKGKAVAAGKSKEHASVNVKSPVVAKKKNRYGV